MFQHRSDREYSLLLNAEMDRRLRSARGAKVRTRNGRVDSPESALRTPPAPLR
jgi:hypothetical protein